MLLVLLGAVIAAMGLVLVAHLPDPGGGPDHLDGRSAAGLRVPCPSADRGHGQAVVAGDLRMPGHPGRPVAHLDHLRAGVLRPARPRHPRAAGRRRGADGPPAMSGAVLHPHQDPRMGASHGDGTIPVRDDGCRPAGPSFLYYRAFTTLRDLARAAQLAPEALGPGRHAVWHNASRPGSPLPGAGLTPAVPRPGGGLGLAAPAPEDPAAGHRSRRR